MALLLYVPILFQILLQAVALSPNDSTTSTLLSQFPAVIAFGDSILDTGNNNVLFTVAKCNFPPYGKDFIGNQSTGRFSNGKVPSDILVSSLGIKELLPPYLTTTQSDELLTGVTFASGGTGYDPLTAKLLSLLSMSDQLDLFKQYKEKLKAIAGEGVEWIISNSLYVITGGNNDVVNTYFGTPLRYVDYNISSYLNYLVLSASSFVQDLYNLGARKIGVIGLPPLGCLPSTRTVAGGDQRVCANDYNRASMEFNDQLSSALRDLNATLPGTKIGYIDIYEPLLDIIQRPREYGFEETTKGCCGTGKIEMAILCNSLSSSTCQDDTKYVFWDSFHPTQRTYEILLSHVREKYLPLFI